jgi:hypothetical protein
LVEAQNPVERSARGVGDHLLERLTLVGAVARYALVGILPHDRVAEFAGVLGHRVPLLRDAGFLAIGGHSQIEHDFHGVFLLFRDFLGRPYPIRRYSLANCFTLAASTIHTFANMVAAIRPRLIIKRT